ncbi:hypothetical protein TNCV_4434001 [Trichonephila clavipes]|nr:hypothetical protein TNCV_4434001 [Trichonephila clavipes]
MKIQLSLNVICDIRRTRDGTWHLRGSGEIWILRYECTMNIENPVKQQTNDISAAKKKIMQERDQGRLTRFIKRDKCATLPKN